MEDPISKLEKVIFKKPLVFPEKLRLFLVLENQYLYINKGSARMGLTDKKIGMFSHLRLERGSILEAFSYLEFLITELIRLKIVGFEYKKAEMVVDIIIKISITARISLLNDWKIIGNNFAKKLKTLFVVRNGFAHKFNVRDIIYGRTELNKSFDIFTSDLRDAWSQLVQIYSEEQEKIDVEKIIKEIEDLKKSVRKKK